MNDTCLVFNVECGILEQYALLLLRSIRAFGGFLKNLDIICVQPRKDFPVSSKTINHIKQLGGEFIREDINRSHRFYALANKPKSCQWVERKFGYKNLIYFDTDLIVLDEPRDLVLDSNIDISMVPVYYKGIGIAKNTDTNYDYWKSLYQFSGININQIKDRVNAFSGDVIFPYWNTAVVSMKCNAGICDRWSALVEKALDTYALPAGSNYFVEESSLSAVISAHGYKINSLPMLYNFPIEPKFVELGFYENFVLEDIIICHHLQELNLLNKLIHQSSGNMALTYKAEWVTKQIKELGLQDNPAMRFNHRYYLTRRYILEKLYYLKFKFESK